MVARRRARASFLPSDRESTRHRPTRRQALVLFAVLALVAGGVSLASALVKPATARSFHLFFGTTYLNDDSSPVAVDLASGKPTVRLRNALSAVSATRSDQLDMVPLAGATLMLDSSSGEFNMLDSSGYVINSDQGVRTPTFAGSSASGIAAGDSAYIVQTTTATSRVYLVSQSTVASAIGAQAPPRASASLSVPEFSDTDARVTGSAASANGALWLLTGSGSAHQLHQLTVPAGSNAGATLNDAVRARLTGAHAAIETVSTSNTGAQSDGVAVATPAAVDVYLGGVHRRLALPRALTGLDRLLPVTDLHDTAAFLAHDDDGWNLITAAMTGGSAAVHSLGAIQSGVTLAQPAESNGRLYTIDTNATGRLWRIGLDGSAEAVAGALNYPLLANEALDLGAGTQVIGRGSRVLVNSRANYEAEVVFTDGSQAPRVVDKRSALQVDTNGAASVVAGGAAPSKSNAPPPVAHPQPAQAVNDTIDCKTASQTPHIPRVSLTEAAAESVQLRWLYTKLDPSDCYPSTYVVSVAVVSGDAPPPPAPLTVTGATGANITGLFPDTLYAFTVTAYINNRGTPSAPLQVRTAVAGPAAPTDVHAVATSDGNWTVSWNSCGGVQDGCVPSASWQIIPSYCDGAGGLTNPPATRAIIGDPTQHSFTYTYAVDDSLLGRGLSFDVEGVGTSGTVGASASDHSCQYSWTPPVTSAISVAASTPPTTSSSGTTSSTVTVTFDGDQTHDLGGTGATLTYELLSGGVVVARSAPTTDTTKTLRGIRPGQSYEAAVVVTPPRHHEDAATVGPVPIVAAVATWPHLTISAVFADQTATTGYLTVTINGLSTAQARGETFDVIGDGSTSESALICGNQVRQLVAFNIDPGNSQVFTGIDRTSYYGANCHVQIVLAQNQGNETSPPVFGAGTTSQVAGTDVAVDPANFVANDNTFNAVWLNASHVQVNYLGNNGAQVLTSNWQMTLTDDGGTTQCGQASAGPNATITVTDDCLQNLPANPNWMVTITHNYLLGPAAPVTVSVTGNQPTVNAIDTSALSATFEGAVDGNGQAIIDIATTQDLSGYRWTETVTADDDPSGSSCGSGSGTPPTSVSVSTSCTDQFGTGTFTVYLTAVHAGSSQTVNLAVTGHPPTPGGS